MKARYRMQRQPNLDNLATTFNLGAGAPPWTMRRFAASAGRDALLNNFQAARDGDAGNVYWDGRLFGFPNPGGQWWQQVVARLGNVADVSLDEVAGDNRFNLIQELKSGLVTISNVALLFRFLSPKRYGMFSGYLGTDFFPIDWNPEGPGEVPWVDRAYIGFCDRLDLVGGNEMSAADKEHAIWAIWEGGKRQVYDDLPAGMRSALARCRQEFFCDAQINDLRANVTPLDYFTANQRLPNSLMNLAEVYFPVRSRLAGKLAREALERAVMLHAAKNFPGQPISLEEIPTAAIGADRNAVDFIKLKFTEHLYMAESKAVVVRRSPRPDVVVNPERRSRSTDFFRHNWGELQKVYSTGNECIHAGETPSSEKILDLMAWAKRVSSLPVD